MRYRCPVCLFPKLPYPPADYHICPCCGIEFGNDDEDLTHAQLRELWVASGAPWFFREPPIAWNPWMQLILGGHPESVPEFAHEVKVSRQGEPLSVPIKNSDERLVLLEA